MKLRRGAGSTSAATPTCTSQSCGPSSAGRLNLMIDVDYVVCQCPVPQLEGTEPHSITMRQQDTRGVGIKCATWATAPSMSSEPSLGSSGCSADGSG